MSQMIRAAIARGNVGLAIQNASALIGRPSDFEFVCHANHLISTIIPSV